jgi:cobalt-precorrin-5B (C1)-methyltransferase
MKSRLRHGFTTGTAAAAAAKAAAGYLLSGEKPLSVEVPLPACGRLRVPLARIESEGEAARAVVVKDAGDDPDVTDGAEIHALARLSDSPGVIVLGGRGVGVATLPGLPVAVGEPAVNPDPRRQIEAAVSEVLQGTGRGAAVTLEVPDGERLAKKTMNPRLGIAGGISILGTRGTVIPYSHESWTASIAQAMDVARAHGAEALILATGRRSAGWAARDLPGIHGLACVEMADFFAESLAFARQRGFGRLVLASLFGKLVKQAMGLPNTHARFADIGFDVLAAICAESGMDPQNTALISSCNTARQALEIIRQDPAGRSSLQVVAERALASARGFIGPGPSLASRVYDYEGRLLAKAEQTGEQQ